MACAERLGLVGEAGQGEGMLVVEFYGDDDDDDDDRDGDDDDDNDDDDDDDNKNLLINDNNDASYIFIHMSYISSKHYYNINLLTPKFFHHLFLLHYSRIFSSLGRIFSQNEILEE